MAIEAIFLRLSQAPAGLIFVAPGETRRQKKSHQRAIGNLNRPSCLLARNGSIPIMVLRIRARDVNIDGDSLGT
jgi:hypothetical protein